MTHGNVQTGLRQLREDNRTFARNAGFALMRIKRDSEAVPYLERCYKLDPSDTAVGLALGGTYAKMGKREDALRVYEGIKDRVTGDASFWFNLGVMRMQAKDSAGAEVAYRKSLELNGNDLDTINNLGLLLFKRGQYEEAKTMFDKLSGLNPSSVDARINLATACAKTAKRSARIAVALRTLTKMDEPKAAPKS